MFHQNQKNNPVVPQNEVQKHTKALALILPDPNITPS